MIRTFMIYDHSDRLREVQEVTLKTIRYTHAGCQDLVINVSYSIQSPALGC